jgi:hypothetical protein
MERWSVRCTWKNWKRYKAAPGKFEVERFAFTAQEWLLNLLTWSVVLPRTLPVLLRDHPYATHGSPQEASNSLIILSKYFLRIKYAEGIGKNCNAK